MIKLIRDNPECFIGAICIVLFIALVRWLLGPVALFYIDGIGL